ncbi:unannotated protein [freshwater metagenome]|uniref:Unannotated protein n=1 Tax=freshwater metagenome TaxID=449393 RepID=A0A6J6MUY2_9ZZZZ
MSGNSVIPPQELRLHAPLLDAYLRYFEDGITSFSTPGHKQQAALLDLGLGKVVDADIPLYGGLDEMKLTNGTLAAAEKLAAECWNADWARFSTGGSTHGNQALILAIATPGAKIAITRTAHRSLISALVLGGVEPIWLTPEIDEATGIPLGISTAELSRALEHSPTAVFLTEPGYLGTLSPLRELIDLTHERNIPIIIDQAWGAHFGFHPGIPPHAMELGADAMVTSIHKNLPGYCAASLVVANTTRISAARLEQSFEATHTTSPAGAPLASIDGVRALMQLRGHELIQNLLQNIAHFKNDLKEHFGFDLFIDPDRFAPGSFDATKLVIQTHHFGGDGVAIERALTSHGVRVEMADRDTIIPIVTVADDERSFTILANALKASIIAQAPRAVATALSWRISPTFGVSIREAFFSSSEMVSAVEAAGRISADLIAPYPPGVPVVTPGEVLTQEILSGLAEVAAEGVRIAYSTDPTLATYRVLEK